MKSHGLFKRARRGPVHSPGAQAAERRYEDREVRSYESEYVNGLWHLDFHHGSSRVLLTDGQWAYPILLGILDDHSRLCCHVQWYLAEGARELCHGLSQAFQKRDLPRSILFDNGAAMIAAETEQGLTRLGVLFENTLPYSPYQNGKNETFWAQVEGRLLPMLEGVVDLKLDQLNEATQAWIELEYNRKVHSEIGQTPSHRFLNDKNVAQPCPSTEKLQLAFTTEVRRTRGISSEVCVDLHERFGAWLWSLRSEQACRRANFHGAGDLTSSRPASGWRDDGGQTAPGQVECFNCCS
jgi:transposase InsO family protein